MSTHEDVHVFVVAAPVVDDAAAAGADGADAVRLVQVQVALVLLLDGDDLGQADYGALHAVHALHDYQDLLPGAVRGRLALHDRAPDLGLQVGRVVVLEDLKRMAFLLLEFLSETCLILIYYGI